MRIQSGTLYYLATILSVRALTNKPCCCRWHRTVLKEKLHVNTLRPMSSLQETIGDNDKQGTSDGDEKLNDTPAKPLVNLHTMTVCMVPPAQYKSAWEAVTKARTELKDPGLFRWPPHANLLYPFLNIDPNSDDTMHEEKLQLLGQAVSQCEPFRVALDTFGTFGGKSRGVLFLHPRSFEITAASDDNSNNNTSSSDVNAISEEKQQQQLPDVALVSSSSKKNADNNNNEK